MKKDRRTGALKTLFIFFLFTSFTFFHPYSSAFAQDTLRFQPTKESVQIVLSRMLDRLGVDALGKVTDRISSGTITYRLTDTSYTGRIVLIAAAPNFKRDEMTIKNKTVLHVVDGKHSWVKADTAPVRELKGRTVAGDLADAMFNPERHLLDSGTKVTLLGWTSLDSQTSAYVLKVEFGDAPIQLWYIDMNSWLIIQRSQPSRKLLQVRYSDFRIVDGVTYPFQLDVSGFDHYTIKFDSIKNNTHPDPRLFKLLEY